MTGVCAIVHRVARRIYARIRPAQRGPLSFRPDYQHIHTLEFELGMRNDAPKHMSVKDLAALRPHSAYADPASAKLLSIQDGIKQ